MDAAAVVIKYKVRLTSRLSESSAFLTPGVRAMFISTLAFFCANIFVKQVAHIPPMEIVFFRCLIAASFCVYGLRNEGKGLVGNNHLLLFLRGAFGTMALYLFFVTLQQMPLATAQTIQYLSPIFTALIAVFMLHESVRPIQWAFYALAFGGVLLIQQVDTRVSPFYVALGILSAFGSGMAYNLVRTMRGREHPLTVVLHFQLVGLAAGGVSLLFHWETPRGIDWIYLLLIGVFSQLGQVFLTKALQAERAAGVAIINYTGLVYAIFAGWLIFGEEQSLLALSGMTLVVLGVFLSIFHGRRQARIDEIEATAA